MAAGADPSRREVPNATPPKGKINPLSKMALTFEPQIGF